MANLTVDKILFIADSRGRGLENHLADHLTDSFAVLPHGGATLTDSVKKSTEYLCNDDWTQAYLLAGLCSITYKDKISKIVSLRNVNPSTAVSSYRLEITECFDIIKASTKTVCPKIILAPITGMELGTYNKRTANVHDIAQQPILNETVQKINQLICEVNSSNQVVTPWTARAVHKRSRRMLVHNYTLLSNDGCHLSDELRSYWASALSEAVLKNSCPKNSSCI